MLKNRYTFGKIIAKGSYGLIIEAIDTLKPHLDLVCKLSVHLEFYLTEVKLMQMLKNIPGYVTIHDFGILD
jgi:hypothetical protein